MPLVYLSDVVGAGLVQVVNMIDDKSASFKDLAVESAYRVGGRLVDNYMDTLKLPNFLTGKGTLTTWGDGKDDPNAWETHVAPSSFIKGREYYLAIALVSGADASFRKKQQGSTALWNGLKSSVGQWVADQIFFTSGIKNFAII